MKAIIYTKYGSPDVLELREVEKPIPEEDEVLVKVKATSANPADWHMIRGKPLFSRAMFGLIRPKNRIPGIDIAGVVEAAGKNIKELKKGDEVFGECGWGGGFAEYVCVNVDQVVIKPAKISFEEASSVNVAGITALQGLRFDGKIKHGAKWPVHRKSILINGASGGVGTFAVQIAKAFGAEVTGVCSSRNLDMVKAIGADYVIDYTKQDFTLSGSEYDLVLDTVGNRSVPDYKRILKKDGNCVIVGFTTLGRLMQHSLFGASVSKPGKKGVAVMGTAQPNKTDMTLLKELIESGKIKPVIDRVYNWEEAAEAISYLEKGHAKGKVVLKID